MEFYLKISLILAVSSLFAIFAEAQVTIGTNKPPVPGAILQLKERDGEGANSTKGLLLPRVQLSGHNLDIFEPSPMEADDIYMGLTVWNIRGVGDICKGVNVWTGNRWESILKRKDLTHYDPLTGILTDHEGNIYTTALFGRAGRWMTVNLRTTSSPGSCENVYFPGELTSDDFSNRMEIRVAHYPNGSLSEVTAIRPVTWTEEQGMLYSWALATNGKGGSNGQGNEDNQEGNGANVDEYYEQKVRRQGICPSGWHLPSLTEWQELFAVLKEDAEANLDNYANYSSRPYAVGTRGGATTAKSNTPLKSNQIPDGASKTALEGGFDVLMVGAKTGNSMIYGNEASFWTASSSIGVATLTNKAAYATTFRPAESTSLVVGSAMRTFLYSVRCKQD